MYLTIQELNLIADSLELQLLKTKEFALLYGASNSVNNYRLVELQKRVIDERNRLLKQAEPVFENDCPF